MNKTELAKLLIKHPEIKALYESRAFDTSTINKVIAEEIMNEQGGKDSFKKIVKTTTDRLSQPINLKDGQTISDWMKDSFEGTPNYENATDEERVYYNYILNALQDVGDDTDAAYEKISKMYNQDPPQQSGQSGATDGRVSQAALDTRAELDAEDSLDFRIDAEESFQTWKDELKAASDEGGVEKIVKDFTEVYNAIIKSYEETTTGLFDDSLKQAKREFRALKKLSNRAVARLNKLASQVAQTNDKEDDKAVVKAVVTGEPEVTQQIQSTVAATKEKDEDKIQAGMTAVKDAIAALAKQAQDDAKAANPDLDLSGIEIDDEGGSNDSSIDGSGEEPAERSKVTLDRNTPTLQRLANGFVNLTDEQHAQIAAQLNKKIAKLMKKKKKGEKESEWKELPQEFEDFGGSSAILMFEPGEDNKMTLSTDISDIIPTVDEDGNPITFEVTKQEIIDNKEQIEQMDQKLKEKEKMATKTTDKQALNNKINALRRQEKFEEISKIMEILGKEDSTVEELKAVWPTVPDERIPGYKAALDNLSPSAKKSIQQAQEALRNNAASEEAQRAAEEAAAAAEQEMEKFLNKIENFRSKSAEKIAEKSGKQASEYTQMKVMQNPYFVMFLAQQLAKGNVNESILREEAKFDTNLLQQAINDNKQEVEIIAADSGIDLAAAIKAKFGIEIRDTAELTRGDPKEVLKDLHAKYVEKKGSDDGFNDMVKSLARKHKDRDGKPDIDKIKSEIEGYLISDDSTDQVSGDDSGMEPGEADNIIATTLQSLESKVEDFPELLANEQFKSLLAMALRNAGVDLGQSSDTDAEEDEELVDADSGSTMQESLSGIYLTEEDPPPTVQDDDETGKPLSTDEASGLFAEIKRMQELFDGQEELKTINVMDLANQAGLEVPEEQELTAEQGATDGDQAAEVDSQKEAATFAEIYAALIPSMDNFFSTEQATKLGFMEQFLLESQSALLWDLIGNLTKIAEKGKARAFTKRKEKEQAQLSGQGSPEEQGDLSEAFNPFKRDKEPVEISKEDQISLKTDLKALLQTLRATKAMIGSYEENMTRVSVDPGLDGSALKEQLDQYLPMVQKSIAKIVERANEAFIKATELNAPKEEPEVTQPADSSDDTKPVQGAEQSPDQQNEHLINAIFEAIAPALDGMHGLQEETGRDETINMVDSIYNEMRAIYAPVGEGEDSEGLRGFMEVGDRSRAIQQAERMLEVATKEEFIKLFPGGRIGEGGMPATVNAAIETLGREIKKLVLIMRDVVTLASKSTIPHSKLAEIVKSLRMISISIYNSFGAKVMISGETLEQIEERLGKDENNKSLTDTPSKPGLVDKIRDLAGKGLEILKKMFEWLSDETMKLLLKIFGEDKDLAKKLVEPFGELVVKQGGELTQGTPAVKQIEELMVQTLESKSWFDSLKPEQQSAVTELIDAIYKERDLLQELDMSAMGVVPSEVRGQISSQYQMAMILVLKKMDEEKQNLLTSLMSENEDEFVSYLVNQHQLRQKMGEEKAKQVMDSVPKSKGSDPSKQATSDTSDASGSADVGIDNLSNLSDEEKERLKNQIDALVNAIATSMVSKLEEDLLKETSDPTVFLTHPEDDRKFKISFLEMKEDVLSNPNGELRFEPEDSEPFTVPKSEILNDDAVASTLVIIKYPKTGELDVYESIDPVVEKIKDETYTEEFQIREFGGAWETLGESDDEGIRAALSGEEVSTDSGFAKTMMTYLKSENVIIDPSVLETFEKENPDFVPLLKEAAIEKPDIYAEIAKRVAQETSSSTTDTSDASSSTTDTSDASDSGDASLDDNSPVPSSDIEGEDTEDEEDEGDDFLEEPHKNVNLTRDLYTPVLKTFTSGDKITNKDEVIDNLGKLAFTLKSLFSRSGDINEGLGTFIKGAKDKFGLRNLRKKLVNNDEVKTRDGRKISPANFDTPSLKNILLKLKKLKMSEENIVNYIKYIMESNFDVKLARTKAIKDQDGDFWDDTDRFHASLGGDRVAEALKPIIEKMLKEHYNY